MKDDAVPLLDHVNRLLELAELARHAAPEDRLRLERTIELVGQALVAVTQAQEAVLQARSLKGQADANLEHRQSELVALLAELRIMNDHIPK